MIETGRPDPANVWRGGATGSVTGNGILRKHLAQLGCKVKGPMTASDAEKGEKGSIAEPELSEEVDFRSTDLLRVPHPSRSAPHHGGDTFASRPQFSRRIRFALERLVQALSDDWRRDCGEQNARFLWAAVATCFGAASYYSLPDEPSIWFLIAALLTILSVVWFRARKGLVVFPLVLIAMGGAGLTAAAFHGAYFSTPVLNEDGSAWVTGTVQKIEHREKAGKKDERWTVKVEQIEHVPDQQTPLRLLLIRKSLGEQYHVGDRLRFKAQLIALQSPAFPGGFDYGRYLWARSIGGQGYLSRSIDRMEQGSGPEGQTIFEAFSLMIERSRNGIASYISERMVGPAAGLAIALSVGKRDHLAADVEEALRQSGLAHILAISGLHMALVTMSVFWGVRSLLALVPHLALHYPIKQWAAGAALVCAGFYLVLSGASVATIRAFFMTAIFLVAILIGRPALTMHNLALAMLLVIFVQPFAVAEAGMQMSFAATAALIASYDRLRSWRKRGDGREHQPQLTKGGNRIVLTIWQSGLRWFGGIGSTALIAGLAVLPFSIIHFQQMAPLGLLANLMAMPIVSLVVMPLGLLSVVCVPFGLQSLPLAGAEWGLNLVISSAGFVSDLSDSRFLVVSGAGLSVGLVVLAIAIFTIHRGWLTLVALLPATLAAAFWIGNEAPDLWVSQSGTTVAYRDRDHHWQLLGSNRKTLAYTALLRADGDLRALGEVVRVKDKEGSLRSSSSMRIGCDRSGCVVRGLPTQEGDPTPFSVAVVKRPDAFSEDCLRADIVVSRLPAPIHCQAQSLLLDKRILDAAGGSFVYFEENSAGLWAKTRSAMGLRSDEPQKEIWTARHVSAVGTGHRPWHASLHQTKTAGTP